MHSCLILLALGLVAVGQAAPLAEDSTWAWQQFKSIHGKQYVDKQEEDARKSIFEQNLVTIQKHNELYSAGLETYAMAVNHLSDMNLHEVIGSGLLLSNMTVEPAYVSGEDLNAGHVDWRERRGVVTPVKNQGQCGSCWAFATTGTLEGQWMLRKRHAVSLSEQQLVDCSTNFANHGCRGGMMDRAYRYIKYAGGIQSERDYPYKAYDDNCHFRRSQSVATVRGYHAIRSGDERELTQTVQTVGPVAVAIMVTYNFQHYSHGVLVDPACNSHDINHGVLVVGFGTDSGAGDYYIVKNSWSARWGEAGYIRMARNRGNMCAIATVASYPLV